MATYVLVHGGFVGGWAWRRVRRALEENGHTVYTPTLTGLGERAHLTSPILDLETHIEDICNVLIFEELDNVVLVGSSYSGMILTGVADRMPQRLVHLVYIDGFLPRNGESVFDLITPSLRSQFLAQANTVGDGWRVSPLSDGDPRRVAQPLKTLKQPIMLSDKKPQPIAKTFIRCVDPTSPSAELSAERALNEPGWRYKELKSGHNAALQSPSALSQLLLEVIEITF